MHNLKYSFWQKVLVDYGIIDSSSLYLNEPPLRGIVWVCLKNTFSFRPLHKNKHRFFILRLES